MKKVLFMHTGSGNHGCEAIIRSTSAMLSGPRDLVLWSLNRAEDEQYGAAEGFEQIVESEEIRRFSPAYFEALFRRKVLHDEEANLNIFLRETFKDTVALSVGGDNYCYPWSAKQAVLLNRKIRKVCRHSVLWGCSINEDAITPEVAEDLAAYDLITARECLTYELLKPINPNTVQVADPAFLLETVKKPLPERFIDGNTVGINVSPMIMGYSENSALVMRNYVKLMEYILNNTEMNICLIPHVVWEKNDDREPIQKLYEMFADTGRVCMLGDCPAVELKGYIARCRFFVGARTHATIAAYSSCVPTLVAGYSIKSRGIARDLFGTEESYVVPVQEMQEEDELVRAFNWILENEEEIKKKLSDMIPEYQSLARTGILVLEKLK